MTVTQDYKSLTLPERIVIRKALSLYVQELAKTLGYIGSMKTKGAHAALATQLQADLKHAGTAQAKVSV